jgi:serine/threonine protein kinase/Ca2+-binding EF-hand superfamily protein
VQHWAALLIHSTTNKANWGVKRMARVAKPVVENPLLAEAIERFNKIEHIQKLVHRYDTDQSRLIASGSYGDVYDAHIRDGPGGAIGTHIALKVISIRALDSKIREMVSVLREIAVLEDVKSFVPARDRHRLVGMYEVRRTRDHLLIAMKRCSSHDLFFCITDKRLVMSEANIAWIVRELCLALVSLHSAGCIHRDIKPENILTLANEPVASAAPTAAGPAGSPAGPALTRTLTSSPVDPGFQVLLGDFGYAHRSKLFKTDIYAGRFLGTAQYAAPEVLLEGKHTAAADMWSLGNVMFALCVGDVPFHGRSRPQVLRSMREAGDTVALTGPHWEKVSSACKDLVSRMLQFDPGSRISADEAARHPFLQGSAVLSPGSHVDELQARLRRFNATRRWRRAALACVAGSQLARIRAAAVQAASSGKVVARADSLASAVAEPAPAPPGKASDRASSRRSSRHGATASSKPTGESLPAEAAAQALQAASDSPGSVTEPKIHFPRHKALTHAFAVECHRLQSGAEPAGARSAASTARPDTVRASAGPDSRARSLAAAGSTATATPSLASESSAASSHSIQEQLHLTRAQFITFLSGPLVASATSSTAATAPVTAAAAASASSASAAAVASGTRQVNQLAASRLFDAFDADGDDRVDLREFCAGIAQVQGDRQTALEMLLSYTDRDSNDTLSATELSLLVRAQATTDEALERTKATMLEEVFRRVDKDESGELRIRDLEQAILGDPELASLLLQSKSAEQPPKTAVAAAEIAPGRKRLRPAAGSAKAAPKRTSEAASAARAGVCAVM